MSRQAFHILISRLHKIAGVIIVIQVLFWAAGGMVMSVFPIEEVRSEHNLKQAVPLDSSINFIDSLNKVASPSDVRSFQAGMISGQAVIQVTYKNEITEVYDAKSGEKLSPFSEDWARKIALADYNDQGTISSVEWMTEDNLYYRGKLPVWQVSFDDSANKVLYVSPRTGRIAARRSTLWRVYDTLWMLHIMDYKTRDNHNNWFLIIASFMLFFFSLSGLILLYFRLRKRDFKIFS